jgi:broad specificity phosphatase PhoE
MLYLVRHGLAAAGVADLDPGLDAVGHRQAQVTAGTLSRPSVARLIVSPLRRTRETAAPLADLLGLAPEIRQEVAEVFDPSMPVAERSSMIGPFMAGRWSEQNDVLRAWRQRVVDTLLAFGLESEAKDQDVVIVSHYIAIGVAIGEATGDDRVVPVPIANCSITAIEIDAVHKGLRVQSAASIAHLPEELVTGLRQALPGGP